MAYLLSSWNLYPRTHDLLFCNNHLTNIEKDWDASEEDLKKFDEKGIEIEIVEKESLEEL